MMTATDRLIAYQDQNNGRAKVTPKQRRRLYSKLRKVEKLSLCPTCNVAGNDPCLTVTGNAAKRRHVNRPTV